MEGPGIEFKPCFALKLKRDAALDQLGSKAAPRQALDLWPALFCPNQLQARNSVTGDRPAGLDTTASSRQGAMLCGVGGELVKHHRQKKSRARLQQHRRSADLHI